MTQTKRPIWLRFGMAVLAPLAALGLTQWLTPLEERAVFLLPIAAVIASAWLSCRP
jgi:hypothetical protein